jgi:hypothetical protein
MPEDFWDQVSQQLGRHENLTYLSHAFVPAIRPFVGDSYGFQVLGAMDSPPNEESLLIDELCHLYILPSQNWSQSLCLNPQPYVYGI